MSKAEVMADLQSKLGHEMHVSDWLEVSQDRINMFADATDDHQWIHVDVDRAKRDSPYKSPIAHGFLTLSLLPKLMGGGRDQPTYPDVKLGVNYGLNKVRFPAPVPAGSRVRAHTKLKEVTEVPGGLQLVREVTVEREGSDKPVCVAESVSRMYFE